MMGHEFFGYGSTFGITAMIFRGVFTLADIGWTGLVGHLAGTPRLRQQARPPGRQQYSNRTAFRPRDLADTLCKRRD